MEIFLNDLQVSLLTQGFPLGSDGKVSAYNAGDLGLILGRGSSLEESMATHSNILAWRIHGQRSLAGYSPWAHTRVRHNSN